MYFLCTAQPETPEIGDKDYFGGFLTVKEKPGAIDSFYKDAEHIPLCMGHVAEESFGSSVPASMSVGKVVDLFMEKDGDLVAKCLLTMDNEEVYKTVMQDIVKNGKAWGVSVRIDWSMPDGLESGGPVFKQITHLALTQQPYLGDHGAYIHHMAFDEKKIDEILLREYYKQGDGHCYASDTLMDKLGIMKVDKKQVAEPEHVPEPDLIVPEKEIALPVSPTFKNDPDLESLYSLMSMDSTTTASPNTEPLAAIPPQQQQQQQQEQQQQDNGNTQAYVKELNDFVSNNGKGSGNNEEITLNELESNFAEFKKRISKAGLTLENCPDHVQEAYLSAIKRINGRKTMLKADITASVGNSGFTEDDAKKFASLIDGTPGMDLEKKRPFVAKLEASMFTMKRTVEENNLLLKRHRALEEEKTTVASERDALLQELESLKKKAKTNEYTPSFGQQQRQSNAPLSKSLISGEENQGFNLFCGNENIDSKDKMMKVTDQAQINAFPLEDLWHGMQATPKTKESHNIFLGMLSSTSAM